MNSNRLTVRGWSNPSSERLYKQLWPDEPLIITLYDGGDQCGSCSFYARFNDDFGLCCRSVSRHSSETIFEHFTCAEYVAEGWDAHSFRDEPVT